MADDVADIHKYFSTQLHQFWMFLFSDSEKLICFINTNYSKHRMKLYYINVW